MAIRPSVKIKDVNGEYIKVNEAVVGRYAEVYGFDSAVRIPVDNKTGLPLASRQQSETMFAKAVDRSSTLIKQYLSEGIKVPEVVITLYDFDKVAGKEKVSYEFKFEEVTFTRKEVFVVNAFSKEAEEFPVMERIFFVAEKVTETYLLDGHMAYQDCYKEKALGAAATA